MREVIVFIEHTGEKPRRVALENATKAREIAGALGGGVHAVVLGKGAAAVAEQLKAYPIDKIHLAEDPEVDAFVIDPQVDYLEAVAKAAGPSLILVPYTMIGRDVGSRLAARLGAGVTADVVDLAASDGRMNCISPKLGGLTITTCTFKSEYGVAAIRPNSFKAVQSSGSGEIGQLAKPPGKTRPIVAIFTHMHNVRAKWVRLTGPHLKVPAQLHRARCSEMLAEALGGTSGRIKKFKRDGFCPSWPVGLEMFSYMLAHEAHHRGQVCMLAHQVGFPLPYNVADGIWNWEKLWKETGSPRGPGSFERARFERL